MLDPKTLLLNLALAAVYAVIGWAAIALALSPGHALPIFPSAGLALAAVLVGGKRMLPGIFVGSLVVTWLAGNASGTHPLILVTVPLLAVLQAVIGGVLMRRWIGYPTALDAPPDILRFVVGVAPLSTLIDASLAAPLHTLVGQMAAERLLEQWFVWWFGDMLGVIVATPLALSVFGAPRGDWRPRRLSLALPMVVATCLLAAILHQLGDGERRRVDAEFARGAGILSRQLEQRLASQSEMLHNARRMILASRFVDRREWREFVLPWFDSYPGMLNFTWNPLVAEAEREAFVAEVRAEGFPDYEILDRDAAGRLRRATASHGGFYLPITYLEPFAPNAAVFGLDPLSVASTAGAIRDTLALGEVRASEPFRLTQEVADQVGVVLYLRVKKAIDGRLRTIGLVSSALRMGDLLEAALYGQTGEAYRLCLIDVGTAGPTRVAGDSGCESRVARSGPSFRKPIAFAGRNWQLLVHPMHVASAMSAGGRATMLLGLAALALLTGFLLLMTGHTRRIEELVEQRTEELAATSRTLMEHQQALTDAQRIAGLGSWQIAEARDEVSCSPQCRKLLGLDERQHFDLETWLEAFDPAYRTRLRDAIDEARALTPGRTESRSMLDCALLDNGGARRVAHLVVEAHRDDHGRVQLRGTVQDVTAARDAEARIRRLADFDTLTGLPNRSYFINHAQRALAAARHHGDHLAVLFIDLDNFKNVNDSLGHQTGDRMLSVVAE